MPYFNGTTEGSAAVSISVKSAGGDSAALNIPTNSSITALEISGAVQDIMEGSNAGILEYSYKQKIALVAKSTLIAYDEAHSSASQKMVLIFENTATGERYTCPVPAPDQAMFLSDGVMINELHAQVIATIAAVSTILNGGVAGGTEWVYVSGYRADYATKLRKPRSGEVAVEPSPAGPPA